jgi:negative regulator of sigma E activity
MTDERENDIEPGPDPDLRAALIDAFGTQPANVDWAAMQARARSAALFRLKSRSRVTPWWEQARPWARKVLPLGAVAAAAALALAMVTPRASSGTTTLASAVAANTSPDPIADAVAMPNANGALSVSVPVDDDWLWNATAAAHAAEGR